MRTKRIVAVVTSVVAAIGLGGVLALSTASAGTTVGLPYDKPYDINAVATTNSAQVQWAITPLDATAKYEVLLGYANEPTFAAVAHVSGIAGYSYTFKNLKPGTAYSVKVEADASNGHAHSGWSVPFTFFTQAVNGTNGTDGKNGTNGTNGAAGPSGVTSVSTVDLGSVASVAAGGPFVANSTEIGTANPITLHAGTYLINFSAKVTPIVQADNTVQVFPQFFVYNQAKNASFTGDLFNVGSGPLESGPNHNIDSYYSGSQVVTVTQDTTLHFYAFGYLSNTGAGTYQLDDASVQIIQITPAA